MVNILIALFIVIMFCGTSPISCLSFFPVLIGVFAGNFLLPIGKPFLQNETFCATFEKTRLVSANLCQLKCRKLLLILTACEQLFEAIPQLVINGCYISRQEGIPVLSILSAITSGGSILLFFLTLPCKMKQMVMDDLFDVNE